MRKAEARCGDETRAGLVKFTRWIGRKTPGEPDRKGASALGAVGCRSPLPRQGVSIAADVSGHLPETDAGTGARRLWGAVPTGAGAGAEVFAATAGPDGEGRRNGGATSAGNSGAPVICRALVGSRGAYRSRRLLSGLGACQGGGNMPFSSPWSAPAIDNTAPFEQHGGLMAGTKQHFCCTRAALTAYGWPKRPRS